MTATDENIKILALRLNSFFRTRNPFIICEEMGITVIYDELIDLYGYYNKVDGCDVICINESLEPCQAAYVCAHELYHFLKDDGENRFYMDRRTYQVPEKFERRANHFAAFLLWPDDDELLEYVDYTREQLSALMGIPEEMVEWRYEQIEPVPRNEGFDW